VGGRLKAPSALGVCGHFVGSVKDIGPIEAIGPIFPERDIVLPHLFNPRLP
jgi:hypothetical protein